MNKHIALIGMMGSGKSTVGQALAERLALPFSDTDVLVEQASGGMSVADIFSTHGEEEFRRREKNVLQQVLANDRRVIATGGGIVLDKDNRVLLHQNAWVVHLDIENEEVINSRLSSEIKQRPLLADANNAAEKIRTLMTKRQPLYEETRHTAIMQKKDEEIDITIGKIIEKLGLIAP